MCYMSGDESSIMEKYLICFLLLTIFVTLSVMRQMNYRLPEW
jgi:hypothetical protein